MSKHLAPPDAPQTEGKKGWNWRRIFPFAFLAVMLVFSTVCGAVAVRMIQTKQSFGKTFIGFFVPSPQQLFGKDRIYLALLGLDYDYNSKDEEYSSDARTDKISIYALDFPTKVVKEIAVPRDTAVTFGGHEQKINAAYHVGGEKMTDAVVGEFLQLPVNEKGTHFDRYIILRINATKDFIDAIGGIDVPVDKEMNYEDNWGHLHIHFHPGMQHMTGDQAVSYARFRHDECGDPCRIKRQQQVTRIAITKLRNERFNDLTHIAALISVINKNVVTNLTDEEKRSLAWHFKDVNMSDIHEQQIAYSDTKDTAYAGNILIPDEKQKAALIADFLGPYTATTPEPHVAAATILPSKVHIDVQNGSGQTGMASKMAEQLRKRGFVVDNVGNAEQMTYDTTVIREHSKVAGVGELVRSNLALKTAAITPAPLSSSTAVKVVSDVTIIVGRDFAMALAAPASAKGPNSQ
jgi:LCP family protein required for cell wall assembly